MDTHSRAQADTVAFLASAEAHGGETPRHLETHLSHVFLTEYRAFKLKKAMRWSLVDYSSLSERQRLCRREVDINDRHAPGLYVGVRAITREDDGRLAFDGLGPAVDYVVEMRRFRREDELDVIVDERRLTGPMADAIAEAIAALHRHAAVVRGGGGAERVARITAQLSRDLAAARPALASDIARWRELAAAETDRLAAVLERRGRHGFVRRCHGDLHLSNICIWEGMPAPFDAVEFSDEVATIDVVYDLAFTLVDLDLRDAAALRFRLLSRWLEETRDYGGLAALPLFLSQRAMVRALVGSAKGRDVAPVLAAAIGILSAPPGPRLVAIGGPSGTGKTTLARALSPELSAPVIRSDAVRKRAAGIPPTVRLPASSYGPGTSAAVYRRMRIEARRALAAGSPVILDATFLEPEERARARHLADDLGVPFAGLWLDAPLETLLERVGSRVGDASDAVGAVVRAQTAHGPVRSDWATVPAGADQEETLAAARSALA